MWNYQCEHGGSEVADVLLIWGPFISKLYIQKTRRKLKLGDQDKPKGPRSVYWACVESLRNQNGLRDWVLVFQWYEGSHRISLVAANSV